MNLTYTELLNRGQRQGQSLKSIIALFAVMKQFWCCLLSGKNGIWLPIFHLFPTVLFVRLYSTWSNSRKGQ